MSRKEWPPVKPRASAEKGTSLPHIDFHVLAFDLLGGTALVGRPVGDDPLDAHFLLRDGIPNRAVYHLASSLKTMGQASIERAIGMSVRTRQRKEKRPEELLSLEQSGRAWQ